MKLTRASILTTLAAAVVVTTAGIASAQSPGTSSGPSPDPSPIPMPEAVQLAPGIYRGPLLSGRPEQWTVTVPDGWEKYYETIWKDLDGRGDYTKLGGPGEVAFGWFVVDNVFRDPCHWKDSLADPPVGPTVDDLAAALGALPGREATGPVDVTLGGLPAKRLELSAVPALADCDDGVYRPILGPGEPLDIDPSDPISALFPGADQRDVMYILDIGGSRWMLWSWHDAAASAQDLADLDAMIASVRIGVPAPSPSPEPDPSAGG
jgi:hypothetical protein